MSREHHCHALNCPASVPPRMHMCAPHWRMVPRPLQRALWASYRRGQERDMQPSPAYLRAAAACVRSVAEQEGQPPDEIEADVRLYIEWAEMIEAEDAEEAAEAPATLFGPNPGTTTQGDHHGPRP